MSFIYQPPPLANELRQGELLANIYSHYPEYPAQGFPPDFSPKVNSASHPLVVVMQADCDLLQDYHIRKVASAAKAPVDESDAKFLRQVLCCEAYSQSDIRRASKEKLDRLQKNQVERYHCLAAADIQGVGKQQEELFFDFRRSIALHTEALYQAVESGAVARIAIVPPVYLQDLMHRFYGYLSRVGAPD